MSDEHKGDSIPTHATRETLERVAEEFMEDLRSIQADPEAYALDALLIRVKEAKADGLISHDDYSRWMISLNLKLERWRFNSHGILEDGEPDPAAIIAFKEFAEINRQIKTNTLEPAASLHKLPAADGEAQT